MQNVNRPAEKKPADYKLYILLLQTVTVAVILLAALGLRFFGGDVYLQLRQMFYAAANDTTRVEEVLTPSASSPEETGQDTNVYSDSQSPNSTTTGLVLDFDAVQTVAKTEDTHYGTALLWPLQGKITSPYGYRNDPINGQKAMHWGIDIHAELGDPIAAAADGTVLTIIECASYGKYVVVQHKGTLTTLYAHCSEILVQEGQTVTAGQTIAKAGSTGRSTAPHLHFETRVGENKINPQWLLSDEVQV